MALRLSAKNGGRRSPRLRALAAAAVLAVGLSAAAASVASGAPAELPGGSVPASAPASRVLSAATASKDFFPEADTYVTASKPTANYGRASRLQVSDSPEARAYLRFNVQGLPGAPQKVTLSLNVARLSKVTAPFELVAVPDSGWDERAVTFANAPALGSVVTSFTPAKNGWTSLDVTSVVAGDGVYSFAVKSSGGQLYFQSRESSSDPKLTVELADPAPAPEPAPSPEPAPAPSPSSSPSPSPASAERFGIAAGGNIHNESSTDLARDLDAYVAVGSRWIRLDINWAVIQRDGPTSYDWAPIDRVVQAATTRGLKVLGVILYTPQWARPGGTGDATYAPANLQDYVRFATEAVRRYSAMGVHAYEIWNEPNISAFWKPKPDPARYAEMLKLVYPAIKAADPSATVVSGGLSPAPNDGTNIHPVTFLAAVYANGAKSSFDAVGHHPYCAPALPGDTQTWSAWYQMYGTSPSLRSVMTDNGDAGKKIWATEFGAPTNGPAGSYVSEQMQADSLTKAFQLFSSYDWAGPIFWYSERDLGTSTDTRENFYGFLRYDFSQKPSYAAFKAATGAS